MAIPLTGECLMSSASTAKGVYGWSSARVELTPYSGSQVGLVGRADVPSDAVLQALFHHLHQLPLWHWFFRREASCCIEWM